MTTPPLPRPNLTSEDVCALYNITDRQLRGMVSRRAIPHYKPGGKTRFDEAELAALFARPVVEPTVRESVVEKVSTQPRKRSVPAPKVKAKSKALVWD